MTPLLCESFRKGFLSVTCLGCSPPGQGAGAPALVLLQEATQQASHVHGLVGFLAHLIAHLTLSGSLCELSALDHLIESFESQGQ